VVSAGTPPQLSKPGVLVSGGGGGGQSSGECCEASGLSSGPASDASSWRTKTALRWCLGQYSEYCARRDMCNIAVLYSHALGRVQGGDKAPVLAGSIP